MTKILPKKDTYVCVVVCRGWKKDFVALKLELQAA